VGTLPVGPDKAAAPDLLGLEPINSEEL